LHFYKSQNPSFKTKIPRRLAALDLGLEIWGFGFDDFKEYANLSHTK